MSGEREPLADAGVRERLSTELGATLFVEAGAGTGKTTALVGRIVAMVRADSCELRDIAAITFTEAAAFELRERVRLALRQAVHEAPEDERFARALGQVDEAAMTTIHGFCQKLLAENPLEAGLPLRFQVLDDIAAAVTFDQRFSSFLDALFDEPAARALLAAASCLQISPDQLRLLAASLDERWEECREVPPMDPDVAGALEAEVGRALRAFGSELKEVVALGAACVEEDDALFARLVALAPELVRFAALEDWVDGLRWIYELQLRRPGNAGRREAWPEVDVAEVRAALGALEASRLEALGAVSEVVLSNLLGRLAEESVRAAAVRRSEGTLRFHDLLALTRELLFHEARIRRAARARYRRILVDEFQDTDPLQLEIVLLLGAEAVGGSPDPGRLFFVGDPKQSIYRFRGADLAMYLAARDALAVGEPARLISNFRSVPGVLDWVNGVFSRLLGPTVLPTEERVADYTPLGAVRPPLGEGPSVVVLGGPSEEPTPAASRRDLEVEEIAAAIELALQEQWVVRDAVGSRPMRLGDIAVLVPRRTGLNALERALEAHTIAYRVASSTLIYGSTEVRDLRAALGALAAGADERSIVGALRTPGFACSDEEILGYRLAGGQFRLDAPPPEDLAGGPVASALAGLWRLAEDQHHLGVVRVLERLVLERHLVALAAAVPHRAEALRRIDFVLDRARSFAESGGEGVAAFISFLDLEAQLGVRSVELPPEEDAEDSVTILTVHGAKGLEFPVVVLAELGGPPGVARRGPTLLRGARGLEARVRTGIETSGYVAALRDDDAAEEEEAMRVAYVAATRAMDHLIVSLHHHPAKSSRARSLAERLYGAWHECGVPVRTLEPGALLASAGSNPSGTSSPRAPGPELTSGDLESWRTAREALLGELARPRSIAATSLVAHTIPPRPRPSIEEEAGEDEGWSRPRAATSFGRAVHAVLQHLDPASPGDLVQLSRLAAVEEGCEQDAAHIAHLAAVALESAVVRRAVASGRCYRELPLSVSIEGGALEAVVDLCFEEDGQLVVVDYKTDALHSREEVAGAALGYRSQAGAYALALEAVCGRPVSAVVLLFLAVPGGPVEHVVEELPAAVADARRLADRALAPSAS